MRAVARWCNGSTADSGSVCHGSNPCRAANSFALSQNLISRLVRYSLVKRLIAHHHRSRAATGQTLYKLDRVFAVLGCLRAMRLRIQPEPLAKMLVEFV